MKTKIDLFLLLLVSFIVFFTWKGILNQGIDGEGFYYFSYAESKISLKSLLTYYDNFPRISTTILGNIFQGNMQSFMDFQLVIIILLACTIYLFVKSVTNNRWISLMASIYFGVNFSGGFQIYARGHFQWFTQRVFELFPFILSTYFLLKFIRTNKKIDYLFSFLLFAFSLIMTHYTTLLLPFYPAILISSALLKKQPLKRKLLYIVLSLPFVILNYLIVQNSSLGPNVVRPNQSFFTVFLQTPDLIYKVSYQLVVNTLPLSFLIPFKFIDVSNIKTIIYWLMIPTYFFYMFIFWFLHKKKVYYFNFIIACFLALIGTFFLNVYVNRVKNIYDEIFQGRYFYIPSFYVGIILSSFIGNLIPDKLLGKKYLKSVLIIAIIFIWSFSNVKLIDSKIHDSQYMHTGGRVILDFLNKNKNNFPDNSIIFLPNPLMPGGKDFLQKYYNNPSKSIDYQFIDIQWKDDIPKNFNPKNIFVFSYTDEYKKGGNAQINKILIKDDSEEYRNVSL